MNPELEDDIEVSKTKRKQEAHALRKLGKQLTELKLAQLEQLPLPENVATEIKEFKRLPNSYGARKRQEQFIGKLMRHSDYEAITEAIEKLERKSAPPPKAARKKTISPSEALCQSLLNGGDNEINSALDQYPQLERQKLRQLQRQHSRGKVESKVKTADKLRNYLDQLIAD